MAVIEAIQTTYMEAEATSVECTSIPSSYEHLQLRWSVRADRAGTVDNIYIQFGTGGGAVDTGGNYSTHAMYGQLTTAGTHLRSGSTGIDAWASTGGTADSAEYGTGIVDILDYVNTNKNTALSSVGGMSGMSDYPIAAFSSGLWDATGAVDRIKLTAANSTNLVRGSEFTLYGLNSS